MFQHFHDLLNVLGTSLRERELGLDRRETDQFYPTDVWSHAIETAFSLAVIIVIPRSTRHLNIWFAHERFKDRIHSGENSVASIQARLGKTISVRQRRPRKRREDVKERAFLRTPMTDQNCNHVVPRYLWRRINHLQLT